MRKQVTDLFPAALMAAALFMLLHRCVPAQAVVQVPGDAPTIAAAFELLPEDGGVIEVTETVVSDRVVMQGKDVVIRGAGESGSIVYVRFLWSDGNASGLTYTGGSISVENLQFQNLTGGQLSYYIDAEAEEVWLTGSAFQSAFIEEGAVLVRGGRYLRIEDCAIHTTVMAMDCEEIDVIESNLRGRTGETPVPFPDEDLRYALPAMILNGTAAARFLSSTLTGGGAPSNPPPAVLLRASHGCESNSVLTVKLEDGATFAECPVQVPDQYPDIATAIMHLSEDMNVVEVSSDIVIPPLSGSEDVVIMGRYGVNPLVTVDTGNGESPAIEWTGGRLELRDFRLSAERSSTTSTLVFTNCTFRIEDVDLYLPPAVEVGPVLTARHCTATSIWSSNFHRLGTLEFDDCDLVRIIHQNATYARESVPGDISISGAQLIWLEGLTFPEESRIIISDADRAELHGLGLRGVSVPLVITSCREARFVDGMVSGGTHAATVSSARFCLVDADAISTTASGAAAVQLLGGATLNDCRPVILVPREEFYIDKAAREAAPGTTLLVTRSLPTFPISVSESDITIEGAPAWDDEVKLEMMFDWAHPVDQPYFQATTATLELRGLSLPRQSWRGVPTILATASTLRLEGVTAGRSGSASSVLEGVTAGRSGSASSVLEGTYLEAYSCPEVTIRDSMMRGLPKMFFSSSPSVWIVRSQLEGLYGGYLYCGYGMPVTSPSRHALEAVEGSAVRIVDSLILGGSTHHGNPIYGCGTPPSFPAAHAVTLSGSTFCVESGLVQGGSPYNSDVVVEPAIIADEGSFVGCTGNSIQLY